ncbi:NAD-dependent epimerase/dehydratase family protein [candidate division WOR-3 bacterium]|nr:NAD-dependent epimerase/dehydratase family protein [candidate division WOR-3 bacterium]
MAKKKLLILGGTRFLGRRLVNAALEERFEVTLFNRGKSNPRLFPNVETLIGDRDGNLLPLKGRQWDVVIDTCGFVPRVVRDSTAFLADSVKQYTFISSISVYADTHTTDQNEEAALSRLDHDTEEVSGETYGALKALCEEEVLKVFPHDRNALIVRPGFIVGSWDPMDRFTYWVDRMGRGGEVLAPGSADRPLQYIDVRDLAGWTVWMAKKHRPGIFNAVGPYEVVTMGHFLETCKEITASDVEITWVSEEFLITEGINLPLWVPESYIGIQTVDNRKFISSGANLRSLEDTIADLQMWIGREREYAPFKDGLTREREAELLAKWRSQGN